MEYSNYKVQFENEQKEVAIPQNVCILKTLEELKLVYGEPSGLFFLNIFGLTDKEFSSIKSINNEPSTEI